MLEVRRGGWVDADAGASHRVAGREQDFAEELARGWELTRLPGGHMRLTRGGHSVGIASSPSDYRGDKNAKSTVRTAEPKAGFTVDEAKKSVVKPKAEKPAKAEEPAAEAADETASDEA